MHSTLTARLLIPVPLALEFVSLGPPTAWLAALGAIFFFNPSSLACAAIIANKSAYKHARAMQVKHMDCKSQNLQHPESISPMGDCKARFDHANFNQ